MYNTLQSDVDKNHVPINILKMLTSIYINRLTPAFIFSYIKKIIICLSS